VTKDRIRLSTYTLEGFELVRVFFYIKTPNLCKRLLIEDIIVPYNEDLWINLKIKTRCCNYLGELDFVILGNSFSDEVGSFIIDSESLKDAAGALSDLSGVHGSIVFAETDPFTDLFTIGDSDEGNAVFLAEGFNQLLVLGFVTVVSQQAESRLLSVIEGLADFVKTFSEVVSERGSLKDSSDGGVQIQFLNNFLNVSSVDHLYCGCVCFKFQR